jgi:GTP cyclohydrolase IA
MQEEITDILVDMLKEELEAKGAIVVISAEHMCMAGRGVEAHEVPTITSSVRGLLMQVPAAREEFFEMIRMSHVK